MAHNNTRTHYGQPVDAYGKTLKEILVKRENLKGDKVKSTKTLPMIKGGGMTGTSSVTESSRTYPKGGGPSLKADFLPSRGKRSKTKYLVGGV